MHIRRREKAYFRHFQHVVRRPASTQLAGSLRAGDHFYRRDDHVPLDVRVVRYEPGYPRRKARVAGIPRLI